jgi:hypothetical protein
MIVDGGIAIMTTRGMSTKSHGLDDCCYKGDSTQNPVAGSMSALAIFRRLFAERTLRP